MSKRFWVIGLLASSCATSSGTGAVSAVPAPKGPVEQKQKLTNITYLDLASCTPRGLEVSSPANTELLVGMLVSHRPEVMECLVDPAHRTVDKDLVVAVETTVTDAGAKTSASSPGLTDAGKRCIEEAVGKAKVAALPKGAAPVSGRAEFRLTAASPMVKMGVNEASDVAGKIRLAAPGWCDCYGSWNGKAPRTVREKLKLVKGKAAEVTAEATGEATTDQVGQCLKGKLQAMKLEPSSDDLTLTYPFVFLNSKVDEENAAETNDVKFLQLDAVRGQRSAETALRVGARVNAVTTYDALVKRYKAKPAATMVKELKDRCAALVKADDDWSAALERQAAVDQRAATLATSLAGKDPSWAAAAEAAEKTKAESAGDVATAKKTHDGDLAVCPKERK